jgi:hypothetical protein
MPRVINGRRRNHNYNHNHNDDDNNNNNIHIHRSFAPEFDDTPIGDFIAWCDGRRPGISPLTATHLGLDHWDYRLRGADVPNYDQRILLFRRIEHLARTSPLKLWQAVNDHLLKELLGEGFEWVRAPRAW